MTHPTVLVWSEVPVTDMKKAMSFYSNVFGFEMTLDENGPNPMAIFQNAKGGQGGHIYPGKPAENGNGPTLHLAVPDALEDAAKRCLAAGGTILCDPITIPPGRFVYAIDPDGNSLGLFEPVAA